MVSFTVNGKAHKVDVAPADQARAAERVKDGSKCRAAYRQGARGI